MENDPESKKREGKGEKNNGKGARKVHVNHVISLLGFPFQFFSFLSRSTMSLEKNCERKTGR